MLPEPHGGHHLLNFDFYVLTEKARAHRLTNVIITCSHAFLRGVHLASKAQLDSSVQ